jgi:hypothetical protein
MALSPYSSLSAGLSTPPAPAQESRRPVRLSDSVAICLASKSRMKQTRSGSGECSNNNSAQPARRCSDLAHTEHENGVGGLPVFLTGRRCRRAGRP